MNGVQFFLSAITSQMSNRKSCHHEDSEAPDSYPAIAYFIVYKESDTCNENVLFTALHNEDVETELTPIRVRTKNATGNEMETAARQLFQVVKDHNNASIQEMLNSSNVYCYRNAGDTSRDDELDSDVEFSSNHFPNRPCVLMVVNQSDFGTSIPAAVEKLQSDGLVVDIGSPRVLNLENPSSSSTSDVVTIIQKIERCMKLCDHALYRSDVYAKPEDSSFAYVKMMGVSSYLHKLLANEALRDKLVQHFQAVERHLLHPACEIIRQIKFEYDLIEVSNGYCFSIKSRRFIPCPISESMRGKLSPRAFVPYDCSTPPQPEYFREGIYNSFPDDDVRAKFLNKFYQCLLPFSMPQKVKKLVVVGPKDSGKTCWANIFHRIIPTGYVASLTRERQFSAAMITNETELVIVDEWSASNIESELVKCILQGGWLVSAVKHGLPRTVMNNSPYYITSNELPNFGKDDENVQRRIEIFSTQSLPRVIPAIDRWMYDHAMDCIAWISDEINANRDRIDPNELWYEDSNTAPLTIASNEGESLFDTEKIKQISYADLCSRQVHDQEDSQSSPTIHEGFLAELNLRRMARKRRMARSQLSSEEEVDEEHHPSVPSDDNEDGQSSVGDAVENRQTSDQQTVEQQPTTCQGEDVRASSSRTCPAPAEVALPPSSTPNAIEARPDEHNTDIREPSTSREPDHVSHNKQPDADDEPEMNSYDIRYYSPPHGWVLNSNVYMDKVACLIKNNFLKTIEKGDLHTFTERRSRAEKKRTKLEKEFWTKPDPTIDAWMLVTGRKREVFDISSFVQRHRDIVPDLRRLRKVVNVHVLTTRCPVIAAVDDMERRERGEPTPEPRLEVPSQSYWTTFKSWRPW
mgnify:FL=1